MVFDAVGTYYFLVKENTGNAVGVTYDESVYRVKVAVTDNASGELQVSCVIYDEEGEEQTAIEFDNTYTPTVNPDTADGILTYIVPIAASGAVIALIARRKKKDEDDD